MHREATKQAARLTTCCWRSPKVFSLSRLKIYRSPSLRISVRHGETLGINMRRLGKRSSHLYSRCLLLNRMIDMNIYMRPQLHKDAETPANMHIYQFISMFCYLLLFIIIIVTGIFLGDWGFVWGHQCTAPKDHMSSPWACSK